MNDYSEIENQENFGFKCTYCGYVSMLEGSFCPGCRQPGSWEKISIKNQAESNKKPTDTVSNPENEINLMQNDNDLQTIKSDKYLKGKEIGCLVCGIMAFATVLVSLCVEFTPAGIVMSILGLIQGSVFTVIAKCMHANVMNETTFYSKKVKIGNGFANASIVLLGILFIIFIVLLAGCASLFSDWSS